MTRHSDTEDKILQAATEVFLEKGRDGARMQEIARQAGINQALLHYYFRTKERLYETVLINLSRNMVRNVIRSLPETDNFEVLLKRFIENYIDHITENIKMVRFILWELEGGGQVFANELRKIFTEQGFSGFPLRGKIEAAIKQGTIRPVDPLHLFLNIVSMCVYPFVARPIIEKVLPIRDVTSSAFIKQRKKEIFQLIWQGLQPPQPG